jgi:hypothetical protein
MASVQQALSKTSRSNGVSDMGTAQCNCRDDDSLRGETKDITFDSEAADPSAVVHALLLLVGQCTLVLLHRRIHTTIAMKQR